MEEKKKTGKTEKRLLAACVFFAASGVLMVCARQIPGFAEWYAVHIYKKLTALFGGVTGMAPFSIVEFGLYIFLACILVSGIWMIVKAAHSGKGQGGALAFQWASGLFLTVSVLLFLYTINCGINYQRESFSEKSGFLSELYTAEELKKLCVWLTEEVNDRAGLVKRNEDGKMILGIADTVSESEGTVQIDTEKKILDSSLNAAVHAMEKLAEIYPDLNGYYPRPKPVCVSEILSYQGLTGVYSPFTVEANYNADMPDYNIPFTLCHELSHLRGFMQEEEANFIAFLACSESEGTDFQYSGYLMAWSYSMNALRRAAAEDWQEVREELAEIVNVDLKENSKFWDSYDGKVAEVSDMVNDTYLKANGQSEGVKSYGKMVDLLIAYAQRETMLSR